MAEDKAPLSVVMVTMSSRSTGTFLQHPRVAIVGGPRTGKTTLAAAVTDRPVFHSDDLISLGWSEASAELARVVNEVDGPVCVEGVAVPRALRKGMRVDAVVVLSKPHVELTKPQAAMTKCVGTVFAEWRADNLDVPVLFPELEDLEAKFLKGEASIPEKLRYKALKAVWGDVLGMLVDRRLKELGR